MRYLHRMQLAIDCASDEPGLALAVDGTAALTLIWRTERNHSVELLPNIDRLLQEAGRGRADIDAVFVDTGPGGYAALRVGVSTAKALAHALGVPLAGVGRLELDAWLVTPPAAGRRIVAAHAAGRGEMAWAAYRLAEDGWHEESPPALLTRQELTRIINDDDILTGDIDPELETMVARAHGDDRAGGLAVGRVLRPDRHRVVALAHLGDQRLRAGLRDDPTALVPLYLRAPAIGPQSS